jgi:hypothetical protein
LDGILSSDRGSAYIEEVNKRIHNALGLQQLFAGARNHRGIGKVERLAGIVKNILQKWNLKLNNLIVNNPNRREACEIIILTLPFIQFGLNQRIYSFTNESANMIMFGENMNELQDITISLSKLDKITSSISFGRP